MEQPVTNPLILLALFALFLFLLSRPKLLGRAAAWLVLLPIRLIFTRRLR